MKLSDAVKAVRCGCPEQYHERFCPACGGTGWIVQAPSWTDAVERLRRFYFPPAAIRARKETP